MAALRTPPPLARAGFGIALAGLALIFALGFSRQIVAGPSGAIGCGSVFSPEGPPGCDSQRSDRTHTMWIVGAPLVGVGLGLVVFVGRRERRRR